MILQELIDYVAQSKLDVIVFDDSNDMNEYVINEEAYQVLVNVISKNSVDDG
jgi:hypothetical protein